MREQQEKCLVCNDLGVEKGDLGGVFSKEGVPRRLLIILTAKLLVDGQYDVCLQPANSAPFDAVQSLFLTR